MIAPSCRSITAVQRVEQFARAARPAADVVAVRARCGPIHSSAVERRVPAVRLGAHVGESAAGLQRCRRTCASSSRAACAASSASSGACSPVHLVEFALDRRRRRRRSSRTARACRPGRSSRAAFVGADVGSIQCQRLAAGDQVERSGPSSSHVLERADLDDDAVPARHLGHLGVDLDAEHARARTASSGTATLPVPQRDVERRDSGSRSTRSAISCVRIARPVAVVLLGDRAEGLGAVAVRCTRADRSVPRSTNPTMPLSARHAPDLVRRRGRAHRVGIGQRRRTADERRERGAGQRRCGNIARRRRTPAARRRAAARARPPGRVAEPPPAEHCRIAAQRDARAAPTTPWRRAARL